MSATQGLPTSSNLNAIPPPHLDITMAGKRTSTVSTASSKKRKNSEAYRGHKITENETCHLLRLPGELRNEIYALVCGCKDEQAILVARNRGKLAHRSSLLRVSHQVRNEFMAVLCTTAPMIMAHVKDFDFGHIITFFNRCDEIELNTLTGAKNVSAGRRAMTIVLHLTSNTCIYTDRLRRWINRSIRPEKQGSAVKLEYRIGPPAPFPFELEATVDMVEQMIEITTHEGKLKVLEEVLDGLDPEKQVRHG